jgi:hypothetical protein
MIVAEDRRGARRGEDIVGLFKLRQVFAGFANRGAIGSGLFGGFGTALRNLEKLYRRTGTLVLRTHGHGAVVGRIAGFVKVIPSEFLLLSVILGSLLSPVLGKSKMAWKNRYLVGATVRNGISDGFYAAWRLSIERAGIAICRLSCQRASHYY